MIVIVPRRTVKFAPAVPILWTSIGGSRLSRVDMPTSDRRAIVLVISRVQLSGTPTTWLFCLTRSGLVGWIAAHHVLETP